MADIRIEKVKAAEDRALPVFAEVEQVLDQMRLRAYELFAGRGFEEGHALDDWLAAEHEICWPAAEFVENDADFVLSMALAGFEPDDIAPKGPQGARRAITALRQGRRLGMLIDQKMNDGIAVPFFGRDAMTAPAPAS